MKCHPWRLNAAAKFLAPWSYNIAIFPTKGYHKHVNEKKHESQLKLTKRKVTWVCTTSPHSRMKIQWLHDFTIRHNVTLDCLFFIVNQVKKTIKLYYKILKILHTFFLVRYIQQTLCLFHQTQNIECKNTFKKFFEVHKNVYNPNKYIKTSSKKTFHCLLNCTTSGNHLFLPSFFSSNSTTIEFPNQ